MEYSSKYGIHLYDTMSHNLLNAWFQNKTEYDVNELNKCISDVKAEYATSKYSDFKTDYHGYLDSLINRSTIS